VSGKSVIAGAIRYGLKHWDGLVRFLADGRIEMDTNAVERAIRPVIVRRLRPRRHQLGCRRLADRDRLMPRAA
jgi:Transposase IS66 family